MTDQNFIVDGNSDNTTIKMGVGLVDREATQFQDWKTKELGLQLILFGLAEIQALRVSQLSTMVYNLERQVFSEENVRDLEPRRLIDVYKMGIDALNQSSTYVRSTLQSVDWSAIEAQLVQINVSKASLPSAENDVVARISSEILAKLTLGLNQSNTSEAKSDEVKPT